MKIHNKLITTEITNSFLYWGLEFSCSIDKEELRRIEEKASKKYPGDFDLMIGETVRLIGKLIIKQHS